MVAYLNKSDASEGFNQIIDFLNGTYIKLQDLVDKKKVVITEVTIRDALRLDDAEGVDCLLNEQIFAKLALQHTLPQSPLPQSQPPPQAQPQAADFPMSLLQEALDACDALTRRVEHLEYDKVVQALEITKLKRKMEDASNQGRMTNVLMVDKEDEMKTKEAMGAGDD
nr:hypothetical protein [Tanacetum cinerariifolium]GFB30757.1 hypothetical protein [Tanacetum cinerariifolium]